MLSASTATNRLAVHYYNKSWTPDQASPVSTLSVSAIIDGLVL